MITILMTITIQGTTIRTTENYNKERLKTPLASAYKSHPGKLNSPGCDHFNYLAGFSGICMVTMVLLSEAGADITTTTRSPLSF